MKRTYYGLLFIIILTISNICLAENNKKEGSATNKGKLEITVSYEKQSGMASNQYAIWIEDSQGRLVKTLFVTKFTANGGYTYRPNCVPLWLEKANPGSLSKSEVDAFTGATPKSGDHTYIWDLTDKNGNAVAAGEGEYNFIVQGTLYNESQVIFRGPVKINDREVTIATIPKYNSESSRNKDMITKVTARYIPE